MKKLPRAYSVMKLYLRETPRIQERIKIETTAEMPLFHAIISYHHFDWNPVVRAGLSEKTLIYLLICNVSNFHVSDGYC